MADRRELRYPIRPSRDAMRDFAGEIRRQMGGTPDFFEQVQSQASLIAGIRGRKKPSQGDLTLATIWVYDRFSDRERILVANARADQAERRAMHDPRTKLLNTDGFIEVSEHFLAVAHRLGIPATYVVIDFDNFGDFNHKYGHPTGDIALEEVAKSLDLRESDITGRYGEGDEFHILMMGTNVIDAATTVFTELQRRVSVDAKDKIEARRRNELGLGDEESRIEPITLSIGAVDTTIPTYRPIHRVELYARADQAVYSAKDRGRNRAVVVKSINPSTGAIEYFDTKTNEIYVMHSRRKVVRAEESTPDQAS